MTGSSCTLAVATLIYLASAAESVKVDGLDFLLDRFWLVLVQLSLAYLMAIHACLGL